MACYHPLKGFIVGITKNGKKDMRIAPYDTECLFKAHGSDVYEKHGHKIDPLIGTGKVYTEFVPIPCGQCVGCRLDYSKQWATRCMLEAEYHDENYFITLTYDDEHLPVTEYIDKDTGEFKYNNGTLVKKHMQDFNKRVRRSLEYRGYDGFRFYMCGEYGTTSARPHYHMIAFGLHLDDLEKYKDTPHGTLYTSKFLSDKWQKGYVIIGNVTYESCAYVSRYIMKKQKGVSANVYSDFNILPEYTNSSRKPGIARQYFEDHFDDLYPSDRIVLIGGRVVSNPRYFDSLIEVIDSDLLQTVKDTRCEIAERIQAYKNELTSETYQEQLRSAERNKEAQIKKLARTL